MQLVEKVNITLILHKIIIVAIKTRHSGWSQGSLGWRRRDLLYITYWLFKRNTKFSAKFPPRFHLTWRAHSANAFRAGWASFFICRMPHHLLVVVPPNWRQFVMAACPFCKLQVWTASFFLPRQMLAQTRLSFWFVASGKCNNFAELPCETCLPACVCSVCGS